MKEIVVELNFINNQKKYVIFICIICLLFSCSSKIYNDSEIPVDGVIEPITDKITINRVAYKEGRHKAFTDITFFDNQFFLVFREADKHAYGENGVVQIFNSSDGLKWDLLKEIVEPGIDLRDPKFALNGDKLSLYIHGSTYQNQKIKSFSGYNLSYSKLDGWQKPQSVLLDNRAVVANVILGNEAWPWRITWHENTAYAVGYNGNEIFDLYKSDDGLFFSKQNVFSSVPKEPSEATIRVSNSGEFFVLARRDKGPALLGRTRKPTEKWEWFAEISIENFRGPNFLILDDNKLLFSGSFYSWVYLGIYDLETNTYKKVIEIPSFGDGSYPGMLIRDNMLWFSYYTSFENIEGSSVYVAVINLENVL
jgi:hypothetical protein